MAETKRAKDILKNNTSAYLDTITNSSYLAYFEGTPTYINYYQLNSAASRSDRTLEDVHSFVGKNTPNVYNKYIDLPVYGVDALDVSNELSERGLLSNVNGEILMLPNTIQPQPGDFFTFDYEGLETHLMRINDVQYDKITPKKYYRCQYQLFQNNSDEIFENVYKEFQCDFDATTGEVTIEEVNEAGNIEDAKNMADSLIDRFEELFYDEGTNTFTCINSLNGQNHEECIWSPYLQHFLCNTDLLQKYSDGIMTEFYLMDIDEADYRQIYKDAAYRNSLFYAVEHKITDLPLSAGFFSIKPYDLKCTRNLPFFMSEMKFKLVAPVYGLVENDPSAYLYSYPIFFDAPIFKDTDHFHKVHIMDELHAARIEPYLKNGDIVYECRQNELIPTGVYQAMEIVEDGETMLQIQDVSISNLLKEDIQTDDLFLFNIIKSYLLGNFVLTDEIISTLKEKYYEPSVSNYMLLPIVIYIIKQVVGK